jgi:large subunit ribosomal protein L4e
MKINVMSMEKKSVGTQELPEQFSEPLRSDLIQRAVIVAQANVRQRYGTDPEAGKKYSSNLSRRRRKYKGAYGKGISRVPRKTMSRRGSQFNWVGATAPGTVGGRRAHPPKAEKILDLKINTAERKKAIRSALAATVDAKVVAERGHIVPEGYPFALSADFEKIAKTKDAFKTLVLLGLEKELERSAKKTVRAGKGTMRGRPYKKRVGPLLVVSSTSSLLKSGKNIPGVAVVSPSMLNAVLLAPGTHPGRLTLYTVDALKEIADKRLFL